MYSNESIRLIELVMIKINLLELQCSCIRETYPALEKIAAMQRRRLSTIAKLALSSAIQSLDAAAEKGIQVDYIVWASQYGDEAKTLKILQDVLQAETPSPTLFSTSVHNAVAGLYSILCQDATPSTSLCATWSEALIEAYAYLKTNAKTNPCKRVLVVYYDEALPALYHEYKNFEGFALSAVVGLDDANLAIDLNALQHHDFKYRDALDFQQFWQQPSGLSPAWSKC